MKQSGNLLFNKPEHFFADGKHVPVSPKEEEAQAAKAGISTFTLFILVVLISAGILYAFAFAMDSLGIKYSSYKSKLAAMWLLLAILSYFFLRNKKVQAAISGSITKHQLQKEQP